MLMRPPYNSCRQNNGCPYTGQSRYPVSCQPQNMNPHNHCSHADAATHVISDDGACPKPAHAPDGGCSKKEHPCQPSQNGCMSKQDKAPLNTFPVGSSYVPMQTWERLYSPANGFSRGTLFEALDYPFLCTNCPEERRGL